MHNEDWSDCADAQADLSIRWAHMSEMPFSHVAAHYNPACRRQNTRKLKFDILLTKS